MERFRKLSAIFTLLVFSLQQIPAIDWQGNAAAASTGEFPSGGYYASSSAFPINSLVDIQNPTNGKKVRVIILKSRTGDGLLLALSPEAAQELGLTGSASINVRASRVPLPSGFGSSYGDEPAFRADPDYFAPENTTALAIDSLPENLQPGPVTTTSPAATSPATTTPVATNPVETTPVATTPVDTPVTNTTPATTTPVTTTPVATTPVETTPVATTPVDTPVTTTTPATTTPATTTPVVTTPGETTPVVTTPTETTPVASTTVPEVSPEVTTPREPETAAIPSPRTDPPQATPPRPTEIVSPSVATTPVTTPSPIPRTWIGIRNGVDDATRRAEGTAQVGTLTRPSTSPSTSVATTPPPVTTTGTRASGGFARGLSTYAAPIPDFNPGDVARPQASLWLEKGLSKPVSSLTSPRVPEAPVVTGPETLPGRGPTGTLPNPAMASLTQPRLPTIPTGIKAPETAVATTTNADEALLYRVGGGMYQRDLDRVQNRSGFSLYRDPMVDSVASDTLGNQPSPVRRGFAAGALPLAGISAKDLENPDSLAPYKVGPAGTVAAGALPSAVLANEERVDGGLPGSSATRSTMVANLPSATPSAMEGPDSLASIKADTPVVATNLPLAGTKPEERPETPVPRGFADSVILSFEPADYRPPKLPGQDLAQPSLVAGTPSGTPVSGSLANPRTPEGAQTSPGLTRPSAGNLAVNPASPNLPGQDLAQVGPGVNRPSAGNLAVNPTAPNLPGQDLPQTGIAATSPSGSPVSTDLANPRSPEGAQASPGVTRPSTGNLAVNPSAPNLPGQDLPQTGIATTSPSGTALASDLANPRSPEGAQTSPGVTRPSTGNLAVNPSSPNLPGQDRPQTGIATTNPSGTAVATDLANPRSPEGAQVSPGVTQPSGSTNLAVDPARPGLPGTDRPQTSIATSTTTNPVTGPLTNPRNPNPEASVVPGPVDPRVGEILAYLEPSTIKPPVTGTTPSTSTTTTTQVPSTTAVPSTAGRPTVTPAQLNAVLGPSYAEAEWAKANLPLAASLQQAAWYIQVGSFSQPRSAALAIQTVAPGYSVVVLPEASGTTGLYKVFVGPLREDEKGLVLYWFRSKGYKDAFARQGAPR